ncbi:hypothetical protein [Snuella sedimenti]|uniref:Lipoprotein n=1 Tax=Snuella sedimenti TaxID=2798802 RepID=A0A8J7LMX2_9FLAO|nr:hypothetical protein [Snuella sedimenti]MBJ6367168.1 hypothetical protein [Snuella sedimenti]
MKTIILIFLSFLIFSCNQIKKENGVQLNGKYSIADFRMTPEFKKDSIGRKKLMSILTSGQYKFDFSLKDSIVKIDPKFGMEYFGDSIFEYKVDKKFIALRNPYKKINLPYKNDHGIIRLLIDKKGIELFSITPSKK